MKSKPIVVENADNKFVLKKHVMKSKNYTVRRADLRVSLTDPEIPVYYTLTQHPDCHTATASLVNFKANETLEIGCQTFIGKNYRRLLRWASR